VQGCRDRKRLQRAIEHVAIVLLAQQTSLQDAIWETGGRYQPFWSGFAFFRGRPGLRKYIPPATPLLGAPGHKKISGQAASREMVLWLTL
jgi:hypothetical protein